MNMKWQQAGQKVKPGLKIAGKLVLLTVLDTARRALPVGR